MRFETGKSVMESRDNPFSMGIRIPWVELILRDEGH